MSKRFFEIYTVTDENKIGQYIGRFSRKADAENFVLKYARRCVIISAPCHKPFKLNCLGGKECY